MDKISSYNIGLTIDTLRDSFQQGKVPEELFGPLQALLQRITEYTAEKPVSIYLFSDDGSAVLIDQFRRVLGTPWFLRLRSASMAALLSADNAGG